MSFSSCLFFYMPLLVFRPYLSVSLFPCERCLVFFVWSHGVRGVFWMSGVERALGCVWKEEGSCISRSQIPARWPFLFPFLFLWEKDRKKQSHRRFSHYLTPSLGYPPLYPLFCDCVSRLVLSVLHISTSLFTKRTFVFFFFFLFLLRCGPCSSYILASRSSRKMGKPSLTYIQYVSSAPAQQGQGAGRGQGMAGHGSAGQGRVVFCWTFGAGPVSCRCSCRWSVHWFVIYPR
jgi:hypothetical protein